MDSLVFLTALCIAEFLHNTLEVWGMRRKVSWLDRVQSGLDSGRVPRNIDTKIWALVIHLLALAVFSSLVFFLLKVANLSDASLVVVSIIALLANYVIATWQVDSYHSHIGRVITRAKNKSD